ncbi:histone acetyltransferase type B catalytic subunit [Striga asiatica]|uniref:Histone acetyltransferase type B catalytic subunit n=1 Tax=Striga asiatica TaxID=4170 RepID=A0A5A7PP72_STRAF|nr:histone acetyltransferase type B catalytic subunit [Striga asiatica]
MEEPVESLQHVRTCTDLQRLLAFDPIHGALDSIISRLKHKNLYKKSQLRYWGPPMSLFEDVPKNLKINKRQLMGICRLPFKSKDGECGVAKPFATSEVAQKVSPRVVRQFKTTKREVSELENQISHLENDLKLLKDQLRSTEELKEQADKDSEQSRQQLSALQEQPSSLAARLPKLEPLTRARNANPARGHEKDGGHSSEPPRPTTHWLVEDMAMSFVNAGVMLSRGLEVAVGAN